MNKFWKWVRNQAPDPENPDQTVEERTLYLDGTIAEESWFDDDVTPALFKQELNSGKGNITLWINSPGGDCFAAASIYNMLRDYAGKVTVKIDGIAASAASVIAMAGDDVQVSPVSMIMIHNPATVAMGDHNDMQKAIEMLDSVKDSIINAYALKTGLSRNKLATLMEDETWMDARKAVELHFADSVIERDALYGKKPDEDNPEEDDPDRGDSDKGDGPEEDPDEGSDKEKKGTDAPTKADKGKDTDEWHQPMLFRQRLAEAAVVNKVADHYKKAVPEPKIPVSTGYKVDDCMARLNFIKKLM